MPAYTVLNVGNKTIEIEDTVETIFLKILKSHKKHIYPEQFGRCIGYTKEGTSFSLIYREQELLRAALLYFPLGTFHLYQQERGCWLDCAHISNADILRCTEAFMHKANERKWKSLVVSPDIIVCEMATKVTDAHP